MRADTLNSSQISRHWIASFPFDKRAGNKQTASAHVLGGAQDSFALVCRQEIYIPRVHVHGRRQPNCPRAIEQAGETLPIGRVVRREWEEHRGYAFDLAPGF